MSLINLACVAAHGKREGGRGKGRGRRGGGIGERGLGRERKGTPAMITPHSSIHPLINIQDCEINKPIKIVFFTLWSVKCTCNLTIERGKGMDRLKVFLRSMVFIKGYTNWINIALKWKEERKFLLETVIYRIIQLSTYLYDCGRFWTNSWSNRRFQKTFELRSVDTHIQLNPSF